MTKIIADVSMSLDGVIGGPNGETEWVLHEWFFEPSKENTDVVEELQETVGAIVMGRRTYDGGDKNDGFADNPFPVPHFVLTHDFPETMAKGETPFTFVTAGVESALTQANEAAGDDEVCVLGGANTVQQCIRAGLLDEIQVHLVPVLLGDGTQLFEQLGPERIDLEPTRVVESPDVTHLRYRVPNQRGESENGAQ